MISLKNSEKLTGVITITPEIYSDFRGTNCEIYNDRTYDMFVDNNDVPLKFVQHSISSSRKNVLRGLHGDSKTWKIIQCFYGTIYFVAVDVRSNSPTFKQHETFELSGENRIQILLPAGFVNGHLCMSENCIFSYHMTEYFSGPKFQKHINAFDDDFDIDWPIKNPIMSDTDKNLKTSI